MCHTVPSHPENCGNTVGEWVNILPAREKSEKCMKNASNQGKVRGFDQIREKVEYLDTFCVTCWDRMTAFQTRTSSK